MSEIRSHPWHQPSADFKVYCANLTKQERLQLFCAYSPTEYDSEYSDWANALHLFQRILDDHQVTSLKVFPKPIQKPELVKASLGVIGTVQDAIRASRPAFRTLFLFHTANLNAVKSTKFYNRSDDLPPTHVYRVESSLIDEKFQLTVLDSAHRAKRIGTSAALKDVKGLALVRYWVDSRPHNKIHLTSIYMYEPAEWNQCLSSTMETIQCDVWAAIAGGLEKGTRRPYRFRPRKLSNLTKCS